MSPHIERLAGGPAIAGSAPTCARVATRVFWGLLFGFVAYGTPGSSRAFAQEADCFPRCRSGYVCDDGECISECNPPCDAGLSCRAGGECVAEPPRELYPHPEPEIEPPPRRRRLHEDDEFVLRLDLGGDGFFGTLGNAVRAGRRFVRRLDPGAERHDGFMLRLTLGIGGGAETLDTGPSEYSMSGVSGTFGIDLGGALNDHVTLHGRFASVSITDPDYSVDGEHRGELDGLRASAFLLGPGVTYYFMPVNVYLTFAAGLSWITIEAQEDDREWSEGGLGFNVDFGKEWWISRNWGIGLAGRLWFSYIDYEDDGREREETFTALCVLFSATYQ